MIRALRRRHKERMKRKAASIYPDDRNPARLADNLCHCSRWCCGHRRRWFGSPARDKRKLSDATVERLLAEFDADGWNADDPYHTRNR